MADLRKLQIDEKAAEEGVWMFYRGEVQFKVGPIESPRYREVYLRVLSGYHKQDEALDEEDMREINARIASDCLLIDWKNVELDGKPLKCDEKNRYEVLRDPDLDVLDWVMRKAADPRPFERGTIERAAGNSSGSSNGAADTAEPSSATES